MPGKVKITSKAFGIHSANAREAADRISRELTAAVEDATEAAMLEITQKIKDEALRLTPVDTGQLRSAAYAKVEPGEDGVVRGRVGYDLNAAPHAIFVHERTEFAA